MSRVVENERSEEEIRRAANEARREGRRHRAMQEAHGAQSDQGDRAYKPRDAPKAEPTAYEGPEESNQQRRS